MLTHTHTHTHTHTLRGEREIAYPRGISPERVLSLTHTAMLAHTHYRSNIHTHNREERGIAHPRGASPARVRMRPRSTPLSSSSPSDSDRPAHSPVSSAWLSSV